MNKRVLKEVIFCYLFFSQLYFISSIIIRFFCMPKYNIVSEIDYLYPTVLIFIIPYFIYYVYLFVGPYLIGLKSIEELHRYTVNLVFSTLIGVIIYLVFPTYIDRSGFVFDESSFLYQIVSFLHRVDIKCNAFPSFHCLLSLLVLDSAKNVYIDKVHIVLFTVITYSICFSSFLIRQHSILDFFGAYILYKFTTFIVGRFDIDARILRFINRRKISVK